MLITTGFHIPYNPELKERSRELRKNMTLEERILWGYLKRYDVVFYRQKPLDNYIVDFYCATKKLVIEIDGVQHYTEDGMEYDDERTKVLEGYGLTVVRFKNSDIREDFERVRDRVKSFLVGVSFDKGTLSQLK